MLAFACASDPAPAPGEATPSDPTSSATHGDTVESLTDEIEFEWRESGCAGLLFSRLHRVDPVAAEVEWTVDTPWAPDGPAVVGDVAFLVDPGLEETPGVVGYDAVTGDGLWQRTLDGSYADLLAIGDNSVAVVVFGQGRFGDPRVVLIDDDGTVGESEVAIGGVAHNDLGPPWWQSAYVVGPGGGAWDPFAPSAPVLPGTGIDEPQAVVVGDTAITFGGSRVGFADRVASWEATVPVDEDFGQVVDVRVGDETVLVLLGSDLGPNRRLVVLDRLDGTLRWTLDGVRDADVAGERVIYDRRTSNPAGDGPTREVFVVAQNDPSTILWTALATSPLGGYFGTVDGRDHFVHRPPSIWPSEPYPATGPETEPQHFEPELRIVGDGGPADTPMTGDSDDRRAPGPALAAGEGWSAAIVGSLVWLATPDGEVATVDLGDPPRHLLAVGDGLLATTGAEEIGCD